MKIFDQAIKERPIIFSAPMVRAIMEGGKTQTRRIVNPQPLSPEVMGLLACPYGVPGDRLWVRETWQVVEGHEETESWEMPQIRWFEVTNWPKKIPAQLPPSHYLRYAADDWTADERDEMEKPYPWRPSIHMPRWASRITLENTGIRVERLQQISEADAKAEGVVNVIDNSSDNFIANNWCARKAFADLCEQIYGAGSWHDNPWVWVIEFGTEAIRQMS